MRIEAKDYSDVGGRRENEDTVGYRLSPAGVVAVVADGLGGQGDGKAASQLICESLLAHGAEDGIPGQEAITRFFDHANRELLSKQKNSFHMKTTAVYLCIKDGQAVWAHIGDSRLYHLHNGKLCHFTLDHSASQLAVYMGEITRDEIPNDAGRSRLLHAMGVEDEHPDVHETISLEPGEHVFLLCSDGLWEYLSDTEIEKAWVKTQTLDAFMELLRFVKDKRSPVDCDNNSAVAVYVEV